MINEAGMAHSDATFLAPPAVDVTSPNSAEVLGVSALVTSISRVQSVLGQDNVATLLVSHGDGTSALKTHLSGCSVELGSSDYSPLFQTWHFVACPAIDKVVGYSAAAPVVVEHAGWRWCGQANKPARIDFLNCPLDFSNCWKSAFFRDVR